MYSEYCIEFFSLTSAIIQLSDSVASNPTHQSETMKIVLALVSLAGLAMTASAAPPQLRRASRKGGVKGVPGKAKQEPDTHRFLKDDKDDEDAIAIEDILGFGCFSEVATTQVQNRGQVAMKDLRVGDHVLTASNDYQLVYAFGHKNPTKLAEFRQVHTQETVLELTAEHLVFVQDQAHPVRADSLEVGDSLLAKEGTAQIITKISTIQRQGLYTPLTPEGTALVNGIAASSYISLQDHQTFLEMKNGLRLPLSQHDFSHMGMTPLRQLCMGVSSSYCNDHYNEEGFPSYVAWAIDTSLWVTEQSALVQALVLTTYLLVFAPLLAAETLFGPSLTPLAIFGLACLLCWRKNLAPQKQKAL